MPEQDLIKWLLKGDVSIQYQTHRDLLDTEKSKLQESPSAFIPQGLLIKGWNNRKIEIA